MRGGELATFVLHGAHYVIIHKLLERVRGEVLLELREQRRLKLILDSQVGESACQTLQASMVAGRARMDTQRRREVALLTPFQ